MIISSEDIQKAKDKLSDNMFEIMMSELGIEEYDDRNKKCCCPFHDEDTPSFIYNSRTGSAHCFGACGRNYDLIDIYLSKGMTYIEAIRRLFELADIPYAFGEYGVQTKPKYRYPKEVVCNDKSMVYKYLDARKISKETVDYLDIRQDKKGNCVFNYYDLNDTLTMVKYRPSHKVVKPEIKNWCQPDADTAPLLFNMNRINTAQPLLICSGELDCAAAIESGWLNAVSIPLGDQNTKWVEENFEWLELFNEIIVCPDNDKSGYKYCSEIVPRLGAWRCKIARVPSDCKDVNEALFRYGKDCVLDLIIHAEDSPVPSVCDLSEVKAIDFCDMDGIKTGIKAIDKELIKLPYGTLTVLSGMPGVGKSSILSQIICNTLEDGKDTWMFSGELSNPITKSWLSYVMAGRRNIEEIENEGDTYYRVKPDALSQINDFYKGRWFVYKDDWDNNIDILIDSMTDSIRKYGVKLLVLDNMMTIVDDTNESELREQTAIVKKLISIARKYNVAIILVCHPRKLSQTSTVGIFDIAGSSNIINLAHRTLGLRRVTEDERDGTDKTSNLKESLKKYDVIVNIIKDRMRGRSNISHGMYYDNISRRFYSTQEEFDKNYSWDTKKYDKPNISEKLLLESSEDEVFGRV